MRRLLCLALFGSAIAGVTGVAALPALAQTQDRIIDVYGDEPCPSSQGQGIVVCRHLPGKEKYRIPKDLREQEADIRKLPGQASYVANTTGGTGVQVNSCSGVGAGVAAGCTKQRLDQWKAQKRAEKKEEAGVP